MFCPYCHNHHCTVYTMTWSLLPLLLLIGIARSMKVLQPRKTEYVGGSDVISIHIYARWFSTPSCVWNSKMFAALYRFVGKLMIIRTFSLANFVNFIFKKHSKSLPRNSTHYALLYPQHGDPIVTIDSVTSLHPVYCCTEYSTDFRVGLRKCPF